MAIEEHEAMLHRGSEAWNAWRKENPRITPDLEDIILKEFYAYGYNLRNVLFVGAILHSKGGNLVEFHNADLEGANFSYADLREVKFCGADLENVTFEKADLEGADFMRAKLRNTNFLNARGLSNSMLATIMCSSTRALPPE